MSHRYHELDLLRSLAVLMMVFYHAAYDLQTFYGWNLDTLNGPWWIFARVTAVLFLLIVGISFSISWSRHSSKSYKKYFLRGLGVILCGMLVTFVTYLWDAETYVRFGILHLIGVSILLLPFFARLGIWNAIVGITIIVLQNILGNLSAVAGRRPALIPFGIIPPDFDSVDYFPLIPWFGFVLIGYAIGLLIYVRGHRPQMLSMLDVPEWTTWPGRHALLIYLLHQPVILGSFGLLGSLGFL